MRTRIEIYKNEEWLELFLGDEKQIKYNLLVNRVGSMSQREISHSNTFTLPYVHQNIQALDINIFNPRNLAKAFNTKYKAKYYVNEKLSQEGFIVINNTENGVININFIDGALDIVEKWGSTSYHGLLTSTEIDIPSPYKESVDIMKAYILSQSNVVTPLQNITGLNFPIAKFPNNLNAIGDKFQQNENGIRLEDKFNPYQSRPIFNVKAFFDIAIKSFDYGPIYDESVDWEKLEGTYIIEKGLSQSQKEGNSNTTIAYPNVPVNTLYGYKQFSANEVSNQTLFVYPLEADALYPNSLTPVLSIPYGVPGFVQTKDYQSLDRCIIVPDKNNLSVGTMNFKAKQTKTQSPPYFGQTIQGIWRREAPAVGYIFKTLVYTDNGDPTQGLIDITINRSTLLSPPTGAAELIGVYLAITDKLTSIQSSEVINMVYTETFLPPKVISYDAFDQYVGESIDLTHAAPRDISIKDLLSSILQKEGILMNFDNRLKTINLFSYSSYIRKRNEGEFDDWSEYHQEYSPPLYNTDYGSEFAVINEVGLLSPYKGNTYKLILANQIKGSKYKEYAENYNKKLKDVEAILLINNPITPYFEYKNLGLGLVEIGPPLGTLTQCRANGNIQGTFTGLASAVNVNFSSLPVGMVAWYDIVDRAVRAQATFLIPLNIIKNLDLSRPIYIRKLGGFYIIEEVEEYTDAQTTVRVKLIKLLIEDKQASAPPLPPNYSSQYSDSYSK
jgi:hypothetical protein